MISLVVASDASPEHCIRAGEHDKRCGAKSARQLEKISESLSAYVEPLASQSLHIADFERKKDPPNHDSPGLGHQRHKFSPGCRKWSLKCGSPSLRPFKK